MKIIKRKSFLFPMNITCKRIVDKYGFAYGKEADFCGSILEIKENDIVKHEWFKYPDYSGTDYGVKCPVCGKFIVIDKDKLPDQIIKNAKSVSVISIKEQ